MDEQGKNGSELALSQGDIDTYKIIAANEKPPPGESVWRLADLGLITPDPHRPGRYVAHDPRDAAQRLVGAELDAIATAAARLSQIPALTDLAPHYDPHRLYGAPGSEFLPTRQAMNARIGEVMAGATTELYTAQPTPPTERDPQTQELGTARGRAAVRHGIEHRALYTSEATNHAPTRAYAASVIEADGEVRVTSVKFPRMVIVDGRHAFIDNVIIPGSEPDAGWHVLDRSVVAWMREGFLSFWWSASRWQDHQHAEETVTSERHRRILRELETGCAQAAIGPRIGLKERTVTKELADLREALGMRSMYQVMVWWALSRERELP
ncbi:hypothetical protein ABZ369_06520 [Streptomyces sp. NPDC005918]|uniref:hypothetical protein n=1 Tax=Streptomyces sp. NPDC005918 TaxID=3155454 RepID=UPI00340FF252